MCLIISKKLYISRACGRALQRLKQQKYINIVPINQVRALFLHKLISAVLPWSVLFCFFSIQTDIWGFLQDYISAWFNCNASLWSSFTMMSGLFAVIVLSLLEISISSNHNAKTRTRHHVVKRRNRKETIRRFCCFLTTMITIEWRWTDKT
jgi:Fe2+ transport system protein B